MSDSPDSPAAPFAAQLAAQLTAGLDELRLDCDAVQRQAMLDYLHEMLRWSARMNLTSVRDPHDAVVKHLLDSLTASTHCQPGKLLDVGSGAGLPGLVLAIARPDLQVTSVDSRQRKISFQNHIARKLGLQNFSGLASRVEDMTVAATWPQIISRAFSSLAAFADVAGRLLDADGKLLAMKGRKPDAEVAELAQGWQVVKIDRLFVPGLEDQRHMLVLSRTPHERRAT